MGQATLPDFGYDMNATAVVCVVGSANMDLIVRAPRLPASGETVPGHSFQVGCGGKGANQAVSAARMGATVALVGRVGGDAFGAQLLEKLRADGVGTDYLRRDAVQQTGVASIVVDDAASNCIVVVPGANGALTADDVRAAAQVVQAARVLLCQLEVPLECVAEAFRLARAAGATTILNPAPAQSLPTELLQLTDLCVPNETEATLLTGIDTATIEGAAAAARALRQRGARAVVVTLGSRGCLFDDGERMELFAAFPVPAVDPTGAGDAFVGALAAALAEGAAAHASIPRACAAAALSVTRVGALATFPTRAEVETFLASRSAVGP